MKRRDFVKGLAVATATVSTAIGQPQPASQAQNPPSTANSASSPQAMSREQRMAQLHTPNIPISQPDAIAMTDVCYFTSARYATLVQLCEIMLPANDDYPSAIKAGTPEFLDFYIGASPEPQQAYYNNGLDQLNAECMKQFSVPFAKADKKQADAVIRPHLKAWHNEYPLPDNQIHFVNQAHHDIRMATINSLAWAKAAEALGERTPGVNLYWNPVDPGIQKWVNHGSAQATSTKHKNS